MEDLGRVVRTDGDTRRCIPCDKVLKTCGAEIPEIKVPAQGLILQSHAKFSHHPVKEPWNMHNLFQ
jgi:hypothetical protein